MISIFRKISYSVSVLWMTFAFAVSGYSAEDHSFGMSNHGNRGGSSSGGGFGGTVWNSEEHKQAMDGWRAEIANVREQAEREAAEGMARIHREPEFIPMSADELDAKVRNSPDIRNLREGVERLKAFKERRDQIREQIQGMDQYETRNEIVEEATDWAKASREYYKQEEFDLGSIAGTVAETLLDVAVSVTPVVGWARDCYEAILGKDLLSGEGLDNTARVLAIAGAITGGFGSKVGKAAKVFQKAMKTEHGVEATLKATKVIDSASTFTDKLSPGKIRTYLSKVDDIPRETLVKDIEAIGLKVKGNNKARPFLEFVDHKGRLRAKIHPPDKATKNHHLHIYDKEGRPMTNALEVITGKKGYRSPDAHIPIKDPS